jgi:CheY-like chemotaxis protein
MVFERFRQADSSSSRRYGGLGIGLTLVKQLVELHAGSVGVQSDGEGRGATFTVTLPLYEPEVGEEQRLRDTEAPPTARPADDAALEGIRVLYVDDDRDARELSEKILADRDADVTLATSADEALTVLRTRRPHVLISDIGLPEVDGYELIRRVRALPMKRRIPAARDLRAQDRQRRCGRAQSHIASCRAQGSSPGGGLAGARRALAPDLGVSNRVPRHAPDTSIAPGDGLVADGGLERGTRLFDLRCGGRAVERRRRGAGRSRHSVTGHRHRRGPAIETPRAADLLAETVDRVPGSPARVHRRTRRRFDGTPGLNDRIRSRGCERASRGDTLLRRQRCGIGLPSSSEGRVRRPSTASVACAGIERRGADVPGRVRAQASPAR